MSDDQISPPPRELASPLEPQLAALLNRHCQENASDTPDFILARYLIDCLEAYNRAIGQREAWYGRSPVAVQPPQTS